jgi:hypothetical protein
MNDCKRRLVLSRLAPDKRTVSKEMKGRFAEGRRQEKIMRGFLREAGVKILPTGEPFFVPSLNLRGEEDDIIVLDGKRYVVDYKSASEAMFRQVDNVESVDDLKKSPFPWIRHYPFQLNSYMAARQVDRGMFLFKSKESGQWRPIECPFDKEDYTTITEGLAFVNDRVSRFDVPSVSEPMEVCEYCEYKNHCWGDISVPKKALAVSSAELYGLLVERDRLLEHDPRPAARLLKDVEDKVRDGASGFGDVIQIGKYRVVTGRTGYKSYDVPPEIKKQYEVRAEKWKPLIIEIVEDRGL